MGCFSEKDEEAVTSLHTPSISFEIACEDSALVLIICTSQDVPIK